MNTNILNTENCEKMEQPPDKISSCSQENCENVEECQPEDISPPALPLPQIETWDELNLPIELLRGIFNYGFETPSAIQKKTILPIIEGRDIIAQSQSGTGKTGAFSIGALAKVDPTKNETQVIVIAHTHELVNQIKTVIGELSSSMDVRVKTLIGGTSVNEDMSELKTNTPHIVVGCTGRIFDMIKRRALNISFVKLCILDEADELLSAGFKDNIYNILQYLPKSMQIALFSATMPDQMLKLTEKFMREPVSIILKPEQLNLEGIEQFYIAVMNDREKFDVLKILFGKLTLSQTIIYVNTVNRVIHLCDTMNKEGFSVCCIHSNMTKAERSEIITNFRKGKFRVLISSNLTARGIDIQQVNTIINFDICRSTETYLHRIGRSGRFGRKGVAVNLVSRMDLECMRNIETKYGINMQELPTNYVFR